MGLNALVRADKKWLGELITRCVPLERFAEALEGRPSDIKVIIDFVQQAAMASRLEDYALIGNCEAAALVGRDGSIDWLCQPRFDSDACFAALVGRSEHGRWLIAFAALSRPQPDRRNALRNSRRRCLAHPFHAARRRAFERCPAR